PPGAIFVCGWSLRRKRRLFDKLDGRAFWRKSAGRACDCQGSLNFKRTRLRRQRDLADCASAMVRSSRFLKKPRAPAGGTSALKKGA
ncbi:MAG TPA: hypothetical protein DDZ68_05925, partial [Parvularcula sp.]|nr:hypothetical protein [Parvularcula sp.]